MGWFSDAWNSVKKIGKSVWNGAKKVGKWVSNAGDTVKNAIGKGYNFIKGIPIIGNMVDNAIDQPILEGLSVRDIAGAADAKFKQFQGVNEKMQKDDFVGATMGAYNMANSVPAIKGGGTGKIKSKLT